MSHRRAEEHKSEPKPVIPSTDESKDPNPFLSKNDITLLSLAIPFLSSNGQRLLSFFINFNQGMSPLPDFSGVQNLFSGSEPNKLLQDLLPTLLGLASKLNQSRVDPSLLTSLLGMFSNNPPQPGQINTDQN